MPEVQSEYPERLRPGKPVELGGEAYFLQRTTSGHWVIGPGREGPRRRVPREIEDLLNYCNLSAEEVVKRTLSNP